MGKNWTREEQNRWEGRFAFSDDLWSKQGLTGAPGHPGGYDLEHVMRMYRQLDPALDLMDNGSRTLVNSVFEVVNTMDAKLMARAPRALLFPRNRNSTSESARVQQVMLNYFVEQLDFKRHGNRAAKDALFAPAGFVIHGYTPEDEFETEGGMRLHRTGPVRPDVPWIARKPIWDIRCDTLSGTLNAESMSWFAFRDFFTPEQISKNPATRNIPIEKIRPTSKFDTDSIAPKSIDKSTSEDWNEFVEVWTVYDQTDRTWFQWSRGVEGGMVRSFDEWPIQAWGELPVSICQFNDAMDSPFSVPYMQAILPLAQERNYVREMTSQIISRMRKVIAIAKDRLDEKSLERVKAGTLDMAEILLVIGEQAGGVIDETTVSDLPQGLMLYDNVLKEDIRETVGVSNMDNARRINVESAFEAAEVAGGSDTHESRNLSAIQSFWKDIYTKWMQTFRTIPREKELLVPIVGIEDFRVLLEIQGDNEDVFANGEPFLGVSPEVARGNFIVQVEHGSTMPRSVREEVALADSWLELSSKFPKNANIQQALIWSARARNLDPRVALQTAQQQQAADQVGAQSTTPDAAQGQGSGGAPIPPIAIAGRS